MLNMCKQDLFLLKMKVHPLLRQASNTDIKQTFSSSVKTRKQKQKCVKLIQITAEKTLINLK